MHADGRTSTLRARPADGQEHDGVVSCRMPCDDAFALLRSSSLTPSATRSHRRQVVRKIPDQVCPGRLPPSAGHQSLLHPAQPQPRVGRTWRPPGCPRSSSSRPVDHDADQADGSLRRDSEEEQGGKAEHRFTSRRADKMIPPRSRHIGATTQQRDDPYPDLLRTVFPSWSPRILHANA